MKARQSGKIRRRGASLVEAAVVLPVMFTLMLCLVVVGMGVHRYQQVARLAREAARYASVRGGNYHRDNPTLPAATPQQIYDQVISPNATNLDPSKLKYSVTWDDGTAYKMPVYLQDATTNTWRRNNVTVTISYAWVPEAYFGALTLSSKSVMPITN
ncbi:MAG: pilus assembly protein [Planctomycetia bacterium]|nr:pilus assembly protein [Planctomycetia bacterium]